MRYRAILTHTLDLRFKTKYQKLNRFVSFWLLCLFCLLSAKNTFGQEQFTLSGHVIDIITKQAVEDANVFIKDAGTGTVTDSSGFFNFKTGLNNFELTISHISYQTNILQFDLTEINKPLHIQLTPKSFELSEAVITAKRQYKYSVTDFHFIDTNILLLAKKHKNNAYELSLINESFDTIAKLTYLPANRQGSIYKDCLGNCHVILKDSAYQVLVEDGKIQLIYPVQVDRFYKLMENCVCATQKHLVFKKPTLTPYLHTYFAVDKESHEVIDFISDLQSEGLYALKEELKFIAEHPEAFPSAAGRTLAIMYAEQIAFKPIYSYVDIVSDTIYYFNHGNDRLELFSKKFEPQKKIDISYHLNDRWKSKIIIDKASNKAYTIFTSGVKYQVHEIDLQKGTTEIKQVIPLAYPEKLKINNGYVYFLYKETGNVWARKELYRLKL